MRSEKRDAGARSPCTDSRPRLSSGAWLRFDVKRGPLETLVTTDTLEKKKALAAELRSAGQPRAAVPNLAIRHVRPRDGSIAKPGIILPDIRETTAYRVLQHIR